MLAHSPGHTKPFIFAASSSAADFMSPTPSKSTSSTKAKSPPLRTICKTQAEATVKKLHVEQTVANLPPSPATKETTIIDLVETSDDTQSQPILTVDSNGSSFGQAIRILSSDSQDSNPSFHKASVQSFPTRELNASQPSPMDCSPQVAEPEPDTSEHSPGENTTNKEAQTNANSQLYSRRGECGEHLANTATKNLNVVS